MFLEVVRFKSKTHNDLVCTLLRHAVAQDVRIRFEFQNELAAAILDFLGGGNLRAVIGNGRAMHKHIGIFHLFKDCLMHVASAPDFRHLNSAGKFRFHRTRDNAHVKAVREERRRNRDCRLSAAAVRYVTHRVNRFFGAASRDEDFFAVAGECRVLRGQEFRRLQDGGIRGFRGGTPRRRGSG